MKWCFNTPDIIARPIISVKNSKKYGVNYIVLTNNICTHCVYSCTQC